ncbi:EamA/RhaT family transporter, partial [Pseudomonas syringae]
MGCVLLAPFLSARHHTLSKYLYGFYPIILVVRARYLVHTMLMACIFRPSAGLRVLRTKRPGLQVLRALDLLGTSLLFTSSLLFIPQAEATAVHFLAPLLVTALSVPLLHERVQRGQRIAMVAGFVVVMISIYPMAELFTPAILLP